MEQKWDQHQVYRLAVENRILRENMPDFQFHDPRGDAYVSGWWSSSRGNKYQLVVELPDAFPDECPACYVADPVPLPGVFKNIVDYGNSHKMHTWISEEHHPNWVKICTYRPESWSASHSIEKVLQKAMLWVEAYEGHMETGRAISDFLMDM